MRNSIITIPKLAAIVPIFVIPILSCLALALLVGDALDYRMYMFLISLSILMILQIQRYDYILRISVLSTFSEKTVDYFLIAFSTATMVSNHFDNPVQLVATVTSIITIFFVPGWALLRLLDDKKTIHKKGHLTVMTFALSIALSGIIGTFSVFLGFPPIVLASIYFVISLLPLIRHAPFFEQRDERKTRSVQSKFRLFDILLLLWLMIFFFYVTSIFYPDMSRLPGQDIATHFSQSKGFLLAPDISDSVYPWYHFLLASVLHLSSSPMLMFQSAMACMSFMLFISFYIMARAYLSGLDRRAPIWATVIFSVFAGFGWLYFLENVPGNAGFDETIQASNLVSAGTLGDIGHGTGGGLWFWLRPLTLGMAVLFVLFFMLVEQKLCKGKFRLYSSLLLVALSQVHFSEFVLFIATILALTIFTPRLKIRLREISLPIIFALAVYLVVAFSYPGVFVSAYFSPQLALVLVVLAGSIFALTRYTRRPFPRIRLKSNTTIIITLFALFVYLVLLFHWFVDTGSFDDYTLFTKLLTLYAVPWQFYPMLLGVAGIVAIIGIPVLLKRNKDSPVIIFIVIFVLMILIGRALTYIGAEYSLTGYFEGRIVFHVFIAASILAPIGILGILQHLDSIQLGFAPVRNSHLLSIAFVSFLVIIGTLSTFLSVQYQLGYIKKYAIADSTIREIQDTIQSDPYSTLLTVSQGSFNIAKFSSPGYLIGFWSNQIWHSRSPELPLNIMSIFNSSFIYVRGNDNSIINNEYKNGYLNGHVLEIAPIAYANESESLKIVQVPDFSPPVASADELVLVTPDVGNLSQGTNYAYDILSFADSEYTTAPVSDISSLRKAHVVVAPNEYIASKLMQYKKEYSLQYEDLIVLNLEGYGSLWNNFTLSGSRNLLPSSSIILGKGAANDKAGTMLLPNNISLVPYVAREISDQMGFFANTGVPFILGKDVNNLKIYYVNINPVVKNSIEENDMSGRIYDFLESILDLLPLNLPKYDSKLQQARGPAAYTTGNVAAFDRGSFEGKIEAISPSGIISNTNGGPIGLTIDGKKSYVKDVSRIVPINVQNLTIRGDNGGYIDKGSGFYSSLETDQSSVTVSGNPATILIERSDNGKVRKASANNGSEIRLDLDRSTITLRQPQILWDGIADFHNFYSYGELYNKLPALGQDITVKGKNSFKIDYSDESVIVSSASLTEKMAVDRIIYQYDELGSLSNILSAGYLRYLISLVVLLAVIGVYLLGRQRQIMEKNTKREIITR